MCHHPPTHIWVLDIKLRFPCLPSKHFTEPFLQPHILFFQVVNLSVKPGVVARESKPEFKSGLSCMARSYLQKGKQKQKQTWNSLFALSPESKENRARACAAHSAPRHSPHRVFMNKRTFFKKSDFSHALDIVSAQ